MNKKEINWNLLLRFRTGEVTEEEKIQVEHWLKEDQENQQYLDFVENIYETPTEVKHEWDADASWKSFTSKYPLDTPMKAVDSNDDSRQKILDSHQFKSRRNNFKWTAVAAVLALIMLTSTYYYWTVITQHQEIAEEPAYYESTARPGSIMHITLTDGTEVTLKPGSTLKYPESFSVLENREVELMGEAYFKVTSHPNKSFIVTAGESATKVLGTAFNVKAYPDVNQVLVAVTEGRVALQGRGDQSELSRVIAKNQLGSFNSADDIIVSDIEDMSVYTSWMDGEYIFKQRPLSHVFPELERMYGIEIKLDTDDADILNRSLTATFYKGQPVSEVLETVAISMDLSFTQHNRTYVFIESQ